MTEPTKTVVSLAGNEPVATIVPLTPEEIAELETLAPVRLPALSARQFYLALALNDLTAAVENTIAAIPEPGQTLVRIELEKATVFERDYPLLVSLATALDLTDEQIDVMWEAALTL